MRINPQLFENGRLRLGSGYPTDVKWHPLYAEGYNLIAASYSTGEIKLFLVNEKEGGKRVKLEHEESYIADNYSECLCLDWSSDGHYIVAGYEDGSLKMFDVFTDKMVKSFGEQMSFISNVRFSPNGRFIVSSTWFSINLWDANTGKEVNGFKCKGDVKDNNGLSFSPDGNLIVSRYRDCDSFDYNIKVWDATTGKEVISFVNNSRQGTSQDVLSVSFSPNGNLVVASYNDNTMKLYDLITGKEVESFDCTGHTNNFNSVTFSPDGRFIASGSWDYSIKLWDATTGNEVVDFYGRGHTGDIRSIAFSPDGRFILSCSQDKTIKLWDINNGEEICGFGAKEHGHIFGVAGVSFSPDSRFIGSVSNDKTIKLWDATYSYMTKAFNGSLTCVDFSPDAKFILTSKDDNTVNICDIISCELTNEIHSVVHSGYGQTIKISPDGRYFIVAGYTDNTVKLFDTSTGKLMSGFDGKGHSERVNCVDFSPDGGSVVSGSNDKTLKKWNSVTGSEVMSFNSNEFVEGATSVSFSPDGCFIASGSLCNKDTLKIWDSKNGRKIVDLGFMGSYVKFSPNGKLIVSSSSNNIINLWDASKGKVLNNFDGRGHTTGKVNCVSFSPNGNFIVSSAVCDNTILIWNLEHLLGESWLKEHLNSPLILTGVWFPDESLQYMRETKQGNIVDNRPIARCGECGLFFPVEDKMRDKELRCPNETERGKCNRLVKLNEFTAGLER